MDRYWLLTSTFYGNWLPGDARGFVSRVRDERPDDPNLAIRREHDLPGTPYDSEVHGLRRAATEVMRGNPVRLNHQQAQILFAQFQETASYRSWQLLAAAIMSNHIHLVVGVDGDPDPGRVLGVFKSYGSRALNKAFGKPTAGTWWTEMGSKRKLPDERAVQAAIEYVRRQERPLVVWCAEASVTRQSDEFFLGQSTRHSDE